MKNKLTKYVIRILAGLLGILTIAVTLFLFLYIFWKGKNVMSLSFILDKPAGVPLGTAGGIYPALMGSIYLGALSALMGGIIGIGVAVYLVFYTRKSIFYHVISACITGLSGIPSILFGLVGYTLLIYQSGLGRSLLCSAICVAVMIVPFIAIRAEKILKEKGTEYMKNSLALGMSREYAVIRLILPVCAVELLGTVALGMAYGQNLHAYYNASNRYFFRKKRRKKEYQATWSPMKRPDVGLSLFPNHSNQWRGRRSGTQHYPPQNRLYYYCSIISSSIFLGLRIFIEPFLLYLIPSDPTASIT